MIRVEGGDLDRRHAALEPYPHAALQPPILTPTPPPQPQPQLQPLAQPLHPYPYPYPYPYPHQVTTPYH